MWKKALKILLILLAGVGTYNVLNMDSVQAKLASVHPLVATVAPAAGSLVLGLTVGLIAFRGHGAAAA